MDANISLSFFLQWLCKLFSLSAPVYSEDTNAERKHTLS